MKTLIAIIMLAAFTAAAQDSKLADYYRNTAKGTIMATSVMDMLAVTNPVPTATNATSLLPGGFGQLAGDVAAFFQDAQPYFGKGLRAGTYGLYNHSKIGCLVDAVYPLNNNMGVGFGVAYLDKQFYDTTINVTIGTTWKVPVIGNVYTWVESGPALNLHDHSVLAQSFAGVTKDITISSWHAYLTGGVGQISTRPGQTYIAGLSIKPPGW